MFIERILYRLSKYCENPRWYGKRKYGTVGVPILMVLLKISQC
jgi:hypothetical protein